MRPFKSYMQEILLVLKINRKYLLKLFFAVLFAIMLIWNIGLNSFFYKRFYGNPIKEGLYTWEKEQIFDYSETLEADVFNGYPVTRVFKKKYALSGMLTYHDDNTTFWKKYFENSGNEIGRTYNRIASHDLTIVWGKMAAPDNLKKIKFVHELNGVMYSCKESDCYVDGAEINNFHIIPANKRIDKALSALPTSRKVPIYVEGYLTNWYGTGDYQYLTMETALDSHTISRQKSGGQRTGLCYQLYLTKFVYDGYVFE